MGISHPEAMETNYLFYSGNVLRYPYKTLNKELSKVQYQNCKSRTKLLVALNRGYNLMCINKNVSNFKAYSWHDITM